MSKILCFAPRSGNTFISDPMSFLHATRLLVANGHTVKIIQSIKGIDFSHELVRESADSQFFAVSSITSSAIREGVMASRLAKFANPSIRVVWGGYHASLLPAQTLEEKSIDAVIVGQGERAFLHYVNGGSDGIFFSQFENINDFPSINYKMVDWELNIRESMWGRRSSRLITSQGCPYHCGFCAEAGTYLKRWSGLTPKRVVDEIAALQQDYNIDCVVVNDPNFFANPTRGLEIAQLILDRKIKINFEGCSGRTRQLLKFENKDWQLLKAAGFKSIFVGADSGSEEGLKLVQKDCTVEDTHKLVKIANDNGIEVTTSTIVGFPYPNKTRQELIDKTREDFNLALNLIPPFHKSLKNVFAIFAYTPYPGTTLYKNCLDYGIKFPDKLIGWSEFELCNAQLPWIPKDIRRKIDFITSYISLWISELPLNQLTYNKWLYFIGKYVTKLCRFRLLHRNFLFPFDYWIFKILIKTFKPKKYQT